MSSKSIAFKTAQYVNIEYELSSTTLRAVSALLDILILWFYSFIMQIFLGVSVFVLKDFGVVQVLYILFVAIPWFLYSPLIEYFTNGKSIGKMIIGIRVVRANGETAGIREYFTRWIFRVVDIWAGAFGLVAILLSSTSEKRQRLGDVMANTVVIRDKDAMQYHLSDILAIKTQGNHVVTYGNVTRFCDEDMLLLKNTILRVQKYPNDENRKFAVNMAVEISTLLGLENVPEKKMEFMKTVLQDYVVLTR